MPEGPRPDPKHDMGIGLADLDCPLTLKALQARIGEPRISRSPSQGKLRPDLTSSWRPSVAMTLPSPLRSWMQSSEYRLLSPVQIAAASARAVSVSAGALVHAAGASGNGAILPNGVAA